MPWAAAAQDAPHATLPRPFRAGALGMTRPARVEQRRHVRHQVACLSAFALFALAGCMNPILRQQSPEARLDLPPTPDVPLIAEYTHPYGMDYTKVESVGLVTGLAGTGSDPPPSPQRAALL